MIYPSRNSFFAFFVALLAGLYYIDLDRVRNKHLLLLRAASLEIIIIVILLRVNFVKQVLFFVIPRSLWRRTSMQFMSSGWMKYHHCSGHLLSFTFRLINLLKW
jgi:hypothetical protein